MNEKIEELMSIVESLLNIDSSNKDILRCQSDKLVKVLNELVGSHYIDVTNIGGYDTNNIF